MILPAAQQYLELIRTEQQSALSFLRPFRFDLAHPRPGLAPYLEGQASLIFRAQHSGREYAVRFFTAAERDSFRRWSELSFYLSRSTFPWATETNFLEEEVVIEGQAYPALLMPWVEAKPLWNYIDEQVKSPEAMRRLQQKILLLTQQLEKDGIAHGDLNLEHILVNERKGDLQLQLIGYDAMFIPPFAGLPSLEVGTPGFQHPMRMADDFYPELDRFSTWIFLAGLEALAINPSLWAGKAEGHSPASLLFSYRDLMEPERSLVFRNLEQTNSEALRFYLSRIRQFAAASDLRTIDRPEIFESSRHRKLTETQASQPKAASSSRICMS